MDELSWLQLNDYEDRLFDRRAEEIGRRPRGRAARESRTGSEPTTEKRLEWAHQYWADLDFEMVLGLTDKILRSDPSPEQQAEALRLRRMANAQLGLRYGRSEERSAWSGIGP